MHRGVHPVAALRPHPNLSSLGILELHERIRLFRDIESVSNDLAVRDLGNHPGITVVLVEADHELVHEARLQEHRLVEHHDVHGNSESIETRVEALLRVSVGCGRHKQLGGALHVTPRLCVEERHRAECVLVSPEDVTEVASIERLLNSEDRTNKLAHDPVHVRHRPSCVRSVLILWNCEQGAQAEREPVEIQLVCVAPVVDDVRRILRVEAVLVFRSEATTTLFLVLSVHAESACNGREEEQAGVSHAALEERAGKIQPLDCR